MAAGDSKSKRRQMASPPRLGPRRASALAKASEIWIGCSFVRIDPPSNGTECFSLSTLIRAAVIRCHRGFFGVGFGGWRQAHVGQAHSQFMRRQEQRPSADYRKPSGSGNRICGASLGLGAVGCGQPQRWTPRGIAFHGLCAMVVLAGPANATWKPNTHRFRPKVQDGIGNAELTDAAKIASRSRSACDHADVVKTQFRVNRPPTATSGTWLDGEQWRRIPPGRHSLGPDGPQPAANAVHLFRQGTCFFPGDGGHLKGLSRSGSDRPFMEPMG